MRHAAAHKNRASAWEDLGLGVAGFAVTAIAVIAIALWTHYVTAALFLLATAGLAWNNGFRPAFVCAVLSTAATWPLVNTLDAGAAHINLPVRVVSVAIVSLVVA